MQRIKIISSEFNKVKQRVVKFLGLGKSDIRTAVQASPPGTDSSPIKDMVAVYSKTISKDGAVVVGYLLKDQLAKPGEHRTFSTDKDGNLKFYIWQKDDGTVEFGGDTKNLVRYQELEQGFNQMKQDLNTHIQNYNTHVHSGVQAGGGSTAITTTISQPSTASIAGAKINEMKTL